MIVDEVLTSGLFEFFRDLMEIDIRYQEKGISDQTSGIENRARMTSKQQSILSQIQVSFRINYVTPLDLLALKQISSNINIIGSEMESSDIFFGCLTNDNFEKDDPELYRYTKELNSLKSNMKLDLVKETIRDDITPLGHFYYNAIASFSGMNILSLVDGFIENFIYSHFKTIDDINDENKRHTVEQELYSNFYRLYLKTLIEFDIKKGLIEDYLNETKHFSYHERYEDSNGGIVGLSTIIYPGGIIEMDGGDQSTVSKKIVDMNNSIKNGDFDYSSIDAIFTCSLPIKDFILFKSFSKCSTVIAEESLAVVYVTEFPKLLLSKHVGMSYSSRLNLSVQHNKEVKNLILTSKQNNSSSYRYRLILSGSRIKFMIKCNLSESNIDNLFDDKNKFKHLLLGLKSDRLYNFLCNIHNLINIIRK